MPKPGFKSITVSENVYNRFFEIYEKNRKDLELRGITSFSGYFTSMMEEMTIRYEVFAKNAPFMEKVDIDHNRVVVKDNKRNRIAEVLLKDGQLQCLLDKRADCVHVGFVYSLPDLYRILNNKNIRISRSQLY
ncbi:MAG TPA: hypothetical protein VE089_11875 [Nitrososphaeraceae archaeon]|nr:hypothetical protein [Nitrososphaeraceae archaeon]